MKVYDTLQHLIENINDDTPAIDAACIFYQSADVAALLKDEVMKFYMVLVGYQSGIFLSWLECNASVSGFSIPVFKKEHNLQDALEWIITKGHRLGNARDLASPAGPSLTFPRLSLNDDRDVPSSPHISLTSPASTREMTPSNPCTLPAISASTRVVLSSPRASPLTPHVPSACAWKKPAATSRSTTILSPESPLLYQYLREIDGIYGELCQPLFNDTPMLSFGLMADWYLQAHGYMAKAILHITCAHNSSASCIEFVKAVTDGMPIAEAHFLWGLITCDNAFTDKRL
ncbi:uncharacterized protein F5147DRAFT_776540 [Suillus discolor]|uniref:Ribonuclease H1 N-terminal domain-containing protein n=1 Tax=Suillus discolor TaxID=1912936 RepID=A0A9P7F2Y2_9AGAM|nr:uncharacterized protein F5147DRAFT_776540 [Suillus discolor]KAG2101884.1 hypothetical protein F5147DRAFT_776540 [Suillus discolor]